MTSIPPWMDGIPFTVAQGRAVGLTYGGMRAGAFERPVRGVRRFGSAGRIDGGIVDRCMAMRLVLPAGAWFSHATAAELWGMPLPAGISNRIHVVTGHGAGVRRDGVIGWRRGGELETDLVHGLPVVSPSEAWVTLSTMTAERGGRIPREWLVAVGDFLLSGRRTRNGREPALASPDELAAAVARHGARRGAADLAWALPRLRSPVDSPPETFLRLGLGRSRLPEPEVQPAVATSGGVRHPDLGYLEERVLLEYLGDVHRTDRRTWLADLERVQLFEDAGYRTILIGAADLTPTGMQALAARIRRALAGAR